MGFFFFCLDHRYSGAGVNSRKNISTFFSENGRKNPCHRSPKTADFFHLFFLPFTPEPSYTSDKGANGEKNAVASSCSFTRISTGKQQWRVPSIVVLISATNIVRRSRRRFFTHIWKQTQVSKQITNGHRECFFFDVKFCFIVVAYMIQHVRVTSGWAVVFARYSGFLHYLQLTSDSHELATVGINLTKNKIPNPNQHVRSTLNYRPCSVLLNPIMSKLHSKQVVCTYATFDSIFVIRHTICTNLNESCK